MASAAIRAITGTAALITVAVACTGPRPFSTGETVPPLPPTTDLPSAPFTTENTPDYTFMTPPQSPGQVIRDVSKLTVGNCVLVQPDPAQEQTMQHIYRVLRQVDPESGILGLARVELVDRRFQDGTETVAYEYWNPGGGLDYHLLGFDEGRVSSTDCPMVEDNRVHLSYGGMMPGDTVPAGI